MQLKIKRKSNAMQPKNKQKINATQLEKAVKKSNATQTKKAETSWKWFSLLD